MNRPAQLAIPGVSQGVYMVMPRNESKGIPKNSPGGQTFLLLNTPNRSSFQLSQPNRLGPSGKA